MLPTSQAALIILLLAIAPGFIMAATWARARTWKGPSGDLRTIIQSLVLSALVQAILVPLTATWIFPVRHSLSDYPARITIWVLLSVVVLPVTLGLLSGALGDWLFSPDERSVKGKFRRFINRLSKIPAAPSIWDWTFGVHILPDGAFVVIEFRDGTKRAGVFASESVAMTSPEPHGLFLEKEWVLNEEGDIWYELPGSAGILIPAGEDIMTMRILEAGNDSST